VGKGREEGNPSQKWFHSRDKFGGWKVEENRAHAKNPGKFLIVRPTNRAGFLEADP